MNKWTLDEVIVLKANKELGYEYLMNTLDKSYKAISMKAHILRIKIGAAKNGRPMIEGITALEARKSGETEKLPVLHPVRLMMCPSSRTMGVKSMGQSARKSTGSTRRWRQIRETILRRDQYICQYCGQDADTVDHVIPISKGGNDLPDNLMAACKRCNYSKSDRMNPRVFDRRSTPPTPRSFSNPQNTSIGHEPKGSL
jgi:hypothetical protein